MERKLALINIILPIILFIILHFANYSENLPYIIMMTLFIGWLLPFINPIITGLSILNDSHRRLSLIFNAITALLCLIIIILICIIYDKNFITMLIEYSILGILSIINTINQIIYLKKYVDPELAEIKKIKKENNGIIK